MTRFQACINEVGKNSHDLRLCYHSEADVKESLTREQFFDSNSQSPGLNQSKTAEVKQAPPAECGLQAVKFKRSRSIKPARNL